MVTAAQSGPKAKTKAKMRYLKKKREKRKGKVKATVKGGGPSVVSNDGDVAESGDELKEVEDHKKRPKKRRKVELDVDVESTEPMTKRRSGSPLQPIEPLGRQRSPTPENRGFLPSFPVPTQPSLPSKSELALLGLDRALVEAEVVWDRGGVDEDDEEREGKSVMDLLSEKMRKRLGELGIRRLFAVQSAILPMLLESFPSKTKITPTRDLYTPYAPPSDVCVSAPTGSGKTLAYVIPIVEILSQRVVTRLRALVVLPTRDLVAQVRETVEVLSRGTGLKIGTATGQHSFAHEQAQLVGDVATISMMGLQGGTSKIDILICTPGRLIDHLTGTPGFTLQHLRFLVIDEADKLLAQSFQDWLAQVNAATRSLSQSLSASLPQPTTSGSSSNARTYPCPDALAPPLFALPSCPPTWSIPRSFFLESPDIPCQKLLFSATLTSDPGKIKSLGLRKCRWVVIRGGVRGSGEQQDEATPRENGRGVLDVVMERFEVPSVLNEHLLVTSASLKPLQFFHLVNTRGVRHALVFTKSAESTARLVRLFEFFEEERIKACLSQDRDAGTRSGKDNDQETGKIVVKAYSSDLPANERRMILEMFKSRKVDILICSDLISRGIDIRHVRHVVSYDIPLDMRKYVHRVGRTARAGEKGDAWSLVEEQEARHFKQMLRDAGHFERVKRLRVGEAELEPLKGFYEVALDRLREAYTRQ